MTTERTQAADREQARAPQPVAGTQRYEANLELVLAGPPIEPLKTIKLNGGDSDPKGSLAATIGRLRRGEFAEVILDRRELPMHRAEKVRAYWTSMVSEVIEKGSLAEPETGGKQKAGVVANRGLQVTRLKLKLNPEEPLFECQILLHASAPTAERATEIVLGLYTAMGREFAGANRLGVWGNQFGMPGAPRLQVAGLKFYATDAYWWRRWWFKVRRETGLFWPAGSTIVAGFEGLIRAFSFPWTDTTSAAPVKTGGTVPEPPAELPTYESEEIA